MKSKILSIATALFCSTAFASQIILIDFGSAAGAGGTGWNTLSNNFSRTASFSLVDSSDTATALTIGPFVPASIEGADADWNVGTGTNHGLQTVDFISDVPWITANAINDFVLASASSSTTSGFYIGGLAPNTEYKIDFIGVGNNQDRITNISFSLFDISDTAAGFETVFTENNYNVRFNPASLTAFELQPRSFTFTTDSTGQNSIRYLANGPNVMNAMQITVIPEPSTILLSLLALGSMALFRRRK